MGKRARRKGIEPERAAPTDGAEAAEGAPRGDTPAEARGDTPPEGAADATPRERQPPGGPGSLYDPRMREVIAYAEEADMLYHLFRWTLLKGAVPTARDWLSREDMPHPDAVSDVFGSWQKFLDYSGLPDSPLLVRLRTLEEGVRDVEVREQHVEREQQRVGDLRRQLDTARRKRDEAEAERDEEAGRAQQAERALADAEARATRAEAALHERREAAEGAASGAPEEASEEWLAAHEAALAELEAVRAHRDELAKRVAELEDAATKDRQAIAELSAALGERPDAEEEAPGEEEAPKSVLEAVRLAAQSSPNLVFTESAFDSAADSPYRRPEEILETLRKLDALAERYNAGEMGVSLGQAAQEAGLAWRAGVSELARTRWAKHYVVTHEGRKLDLGPHVALGSGSGAGFVARIYLHLADGNGDVPRGIYVGHVGRHLPDTTT
jgi:hypothetical protein